MSESPNPSLIRSGRTGPTEKLFVGGLNAVRNHFDPVLTQLFRETTSGEFQGFWLNRFKRTQFHDSDLAIYFQREAHVTGRVVGEEVQHGIDFTMGATRRRIAMEAAKNVAEAQAVDWWHRRVFTRLIQNVNTNAFGMGILIGSTDDIYRAYVRAGGQLTLDEIPGSAFNGLY